MLDSVRAQADVVLDTSDLSLRELRERIFARLGDVQGSDRLSIQLISFGFKYGVPLDADLVLDVRFMKNPHYIEALRPLSGLTAEVREYVLAQPVADALPGPPAGPARPPRAGLRGGGQDPPDRRHRLHRRPAPVRGHVRGAGRLAAGAGLRPRLRLPPGARAVNLRRWLTVGIGVKRWLLLAFLGLLVLAIGVAHVIRQVMADAEPGGPVRCRSIDVLTLQFLPYQLRGLIAGAVGLGLFLYGAYRLVRALVDPFALWDRDQPMVEVIYQKRFLARGPRVVAIGGGTGLSALLRGLKEHTSNLTAVVTVADDGGSSGVLRTELGIPAVGDIRNCIVALADAEPLMGRLLQYRFPGPEPRHRPDRPPTTNPACRPVRGAEALSRGSRRARRRQPAAGGDGRARGRRLRGGRARDEPRARRPGPRGPRDRHGPQPARAARATARRSRARAASPGAATWTGSGSPRRTCAPARTPCGRSRRPRSS